MPSPRAIAAPIFNRDPIPLGRLGEVARTLAARGEQVAQFGIKPAGRGTFAGYTLHRFPSAAALSEEIQADACRCPAEMGGGSRGMGPARVGWRPLAPFGALGMS